jgi:hypothetical protein
MKISQAGRHQRNQEAYENDESDGKPKKKKKLTTEKLSRFVVPTPLQSHHHHQVLNIEGEFAHVQVRNPW